MIGTIRTLPLPTVTAVPFGVISICMVYFPSDALFGCFNATFFGGAAFDFAECGTATVGEDEFLGALVDCGDTGSPHNHGHPHRGICVDTADGVGDPVASGGSEPATVLGFAEGAGVAVVVATVGAIIVP